MKPQITSFTILVDLFRVLDGLRGVFRFEPSKKTRDQIRSFREMRASRIQLLTQ